MFKNLYFDIGIKNPFKKTSPTVVTNSSSVLVETDDLITEKLNSLQAAYPRPELKLPDVSKRYLENNFSGPGKIELPQIIRPPSIEPPGFREESVLTNKSENKKVDDKQEVTPVLTTQEIVKNSDKPENAAKLTPFENIVAKKETYPAKEEKIQESSSGGLGSFFNKLYDHINKEESYLSSNSPKNVLYKNLFTEMQGFWQDKKNDLQRAKYNKALKDDLANKISELQQHEIEWQKLQLSHEKIKDELASKEILIENSIRHLKKSFKKMHLNLDAHPEKYFRLSNGDTLKNLQELADSLKLMDKDVFENHVNDNKNDFASWVEGVFELNDLADDLRTAKSKEHMSTIVDRWYSLV